MKRKGGTRRRVPVVLQMNAVECGAACLAMVLGYFGRKTRLEECRSKCDVGRDGVTAQTMAAAARDFGLRSRAFALRAEELRQVSLPAIIHWNRNHFVVLERWRGESAEIVDPGRGRREITADDFDSGFSGVVLTFEPGQHFSRQAEKESSPTFRWLKRAFRVPGVPKLLVWVLAGSAALQLFGLVLPLFTKLLVDRVLPLRNPGELNMLAAGAVLMAVSYAAVTWFRAVLLIAMETRVDSSLMPEFFRHLLSLPFRFFQERNSGDLAMRLGSNAMIRETLASYTTSAVLDGTLVIVYLVVLLRAAPLFGLAAMTIALLEVGILLGTTRKLHNLMETDLACQSDTQSCLIESLAGISTLKAAGVEERALARWSDRLGEQLRASVQRSRMAAKIEAAVMVLRTLSPLCLLWLGGIEVLNGWMTLGTMLAVNALAAVFLVPVGSLVASAQRLQLAGAYLDRIADVMQAEPEQKPERVKPAPVLSGRVELRNVSFRYDAHARKVLDNVSLQIEPGQKIALVGRSGSGKSTLAKLLLGLYQPCQGEILYDGIPLQNLDVQTVRRQLGAVLQEPFLFSASVRENIAFHERHIPLRDVTSAAETAAVHSDIVQMPMGYETRIDEGGSSLSGGQRQRLAIARAIVHKPALLLLDEATSHLDVSTESIVHQNLDNLQCTCVVVAHRLSTVKNADLIVVLDNGAIVEQGSHVELLNRDGHYAALIRHQLEQAPEHVPALIAAGGEDRFACNAGVSREF